MSGGSPFTLAAASVLGDRVSRIAIVSGVGPIDRPGAFNAVGPAEPTTLAGLIGTCAEVAGTEVEIVPVPADTVPSRLPLVWPPQRWPTQQRSAARARVAGLPATPLAVTAADVLAWVTGGLGPGPGGDHRR